MTTHDAERQKQTGVAIKDREKTEKPPKYKVLLHNDDYTTMDFVIEVLMKIFHRSRTDAIQIMLTVHHSGVGVCGIYTRDVAQTKVAKVIEAARQAGFPLLCSMEPVGSDA